jgi:hypothetical protein
MKHFNPMSFVVGIAIACLSITLCLCIGLLMRHINTETVENAPQPAIVRHISDGPSLTNVSFITWSGLTNCIHIGRHAGLNATNSNEIIVTFKDGTEFRHTFKPGQVIDLQ